MALIQPQEMDFTDENIIMILSGLPGIGKTTLACSAQDVLIVDIDNGMKRVKTEHRKDALIVSTYEELLADLKTTAVKQYKTIVIDTGGALIELMKEWAVTQSGGARKGGQISLQGYGIVKSEFARLFRELRKSYNCLLLFHTLREKDRDGNTIFDIQCEGATKQTVWQPVDLGAYMQIIGEKRYLCFTPTQEYSAKSSYGIKGMIQVPELTSGTKNNFLELLFATVKENISIENAEAAEIKQVYDSIMEQGMILIEAVVDGKTAQEATTAINRLPEALTSKAELIAHFKQKIQSIGITWNHEKKRYE